VSKKITRRKPSKKTPGKTATRKTAARKKTSAKKATSRKAVSKTATVKQAAQPDAFELIAATSRDRPIWLAMRSDLYSGLDEAFHRREIKHILESNDRECLLVRAPGGSIAGFLEVSLRNLVDGCVGGPVGYIEGIYLVPAFRGLGLGGVLIDAAEAWFRSHGCHDMATDTEIDNEDAQAFWTELGFEETWSVVQYRRRIRLPAAARKK
jgi:aminoglycoside 6'-N-acetyltransferase I